MAFTNKVVPADEQETVVQYSRNTDTATIYTTDSTVVNKLDKKYQRTRIHRSGGQISAIEYDIPKKMISYRVKERKLTLTDSQKKNLRASIEKARKEHS